MTDAVFPKKFAINEHSLVLDCIFSPNNSLLVANSLVEAVAADVVVSLEKTLNANFLKGFLCVVEDSTSVCFTTAYTREKMFGKTKN